MYKMSSLFKVTVMKVNTFHVNGRFTVASGWHKLFYSKSPVCLIWTVEFTSYIYNVHSINGFLIKCRYIDKKTIFKKFYYYSDI